MSSGHFPHFHYTLNRELTELYASVAIRDFAQGLITIFAPIYVFLFFRDTLTLPHALSFTLVFFSIAALSQTLIYPIGSKILSFFGVKHAMFFSIPVLFSYYVGLWQIDHLGLFAFAVPLLIGVAGGMYWPAFHLDFTQFTKRGTRGKQISYQSVVVSIATAAAPLIGGLLITFVGFSGLFVIVLAILLISVMPLLLSSEIHDSNHVSIIGAFKDALGRPYRYQMIGFAASTFDATVVEYIWPIFLFTIAISFETLGFIMTGSMILGLLFVLYLGRLVDSRGAERIFKIGVWLNTALWPVRMFARGPWDTFFIQTAHGLSRRTTYLPRGTLSYDWVDQEKNNSRERMRRIIARGISLNGSNAVALLMFAGIFYYVQSLHVAFIIAALTVPLNLIFLRELNTKK